MSLLRSKLFPLSSRLFRTSFVQKSVDLSSYRALNCQSFLYANQQDEAKVLLNYCSKRYLAKNKDRKKESKKGGGIDAPKVILDDEDMSKVYEYDELQSEIEVIIDKFKVELKDNFNVRLNPRQIEG